MSADESYNATARPSPETIEAYAQHIANYMIIYTEDSQVAPDRRDSATAGLFARPECAAILSPSSLSPSGEGSDSFLAKVDAKMEELSRKSPLTVEEYVSLVLMLLRYAEVDRNHRVAAVSSGCTALLMHSSSSTRSKFEWPTIIFATYTGRSTRAVLLLQQPHAEPSVWPSCSHHGWLYDFAATNGILLPKGSVPIRLPGPARPDLTPAPSPSRPPSSCMSKLDAAQVEAFLKTPGDFFDTEFNCVTDDGTSNWVLASVLQEKSGLTFSIRFSDNPDPIPGMDIDSMRLLLTESLMIIRVQASFSY